MTAQRAIGLWGTVGRLSLGLVFLGLAFSDLRFSAYSTPPWHAFVIGLIVLPAGLFALQSIRLRFTMETLNATGPVGYAVNFGVGLVLFLIVSREGALLFYGVSLLLAAVRGYAGCEILAISNWLLRRDDQVGCVVFNPLDAVESRSRQAKA